MTMNMSFDQSDHPGKYEILYEMQMEKHGTYV